ncbi:alpha/beta hydrolase [Verticiella sediminum]|uniref:alpha/beta hydrolase n=1 Tax=Verticiella sediminum TaxID=1247510 RepID=UPI001FE57D6F|nr:alpha/beta hydrolase [Verticiella sediminum]
MESVPFDLSAVPDRAGTVQAALQGAAGRIELLVDRPVGSARGVALITHPQPVLGGSPRHKVPHRLARAVQQSGWIAVRPAFRGVDGSEGVYDEGRGETEDVLLVARAIRAQAGLPLALVGFSFGAFVAGHASAALGAAGEPADVTALAGMPVGTVPAGRYYAAPELAPDALLVHGERDEMAPLASLMDWARERTHPIVVIPGADHFFSGRIDRLVQCVTDRLRLRLADSLSPPRAPRSVRPDGR